MFQSANLLVNLKEYQKPIFSLYGKDYNSVTFFNSSGLGGEIFVLCKCRKVTYSATLAQG